MRMRVMHLVRRSVRLRLRTGRRTQTSVAHRATRARRRTRGWGRRVRKTPLGILNSTILPLEQLLVRIALGVRVLIRLVLLLLWDGDDVLRVGCVHSATGDGAVARAAADGAHGAAAVRARGHRWGRRSRGRTRVRHLPRLCTLLLLGDRDLRDGHRDAAVPREGDLGHAALRWGRELLGRGRVALLLILLGHGRTGR